MRRTRSAKQRAASASSDLAASAATQTMTAVSEPPLRAPPRSRASFVFLQGTCCEPRRSASTTSPRLCRERLMFWASRRRLPSAPLRFTRSSPARSTSRSFPSPTLNMTMTCERELLALASVAATCRRAKPLRIVTRSEARLVPGTSRAPSMVAIEPTEPPRTSSAAEAWPRGTRRSTRVSLCISSIDIRTCLPPAFPNNSAAARCTRPWSPALPYMVCVFPEPEGPYARIVEDSPAIAP
mmetsp:Transcript_123023/g.359095  ORF Transcript_123023/g.359095 Transcript_123023/m.359095 type:complete len:240 (+) Transcript_123023:148-867(+)